MTCDHKKMRTSDNAACVAMECAECGAIDAVVIADLRVELAKLRNVAAAARRANGAHSLWIRGECTSVAVGSAMVDLDEALAALDGGGDGEKVER